MNIYATFNNISVILWRSFLLVEETGITWENHRPTASWHRINVLGCRGVIDYTVDLRICLALIQSKFPWHIKLSICKVGFNVAFTWEGWDLINWCNIATSVCLLHARTWISVCIFRNLFLTILSVKNFWQLSEARGFINVFVISSQCSSANK
jgi:hypothetical protein